MVSLNAENLDSLNSALDRLSAKADAWFQGADVLSNERMVIASADLRYLRQNYELTISLPGCYLSLEDIAEVQTRFHEAHTAEYGHSTPGETIQVVNLRLLAVKILPKPSLPELMPASIPVDEALIETSKVNFPEGQEICMVYHRSMLQAGHTIGRPAIIREKESTTLVNIGWQLRVDKIGNLVINRSK